MQAPHRKVLRDSHVAAIAIAALLAGSIEFLFNALLYPASQFLSFLAIALATHNTPYMPRTIDYAAHFISLEMPIFNLGTALNSLACAWLLSLWVYGKGPLRVLRSYWEIIPSSLTRGSALRLGMNGRRLFRN